MLEFKLGCYRNPSRSLGETPRIHTRLSSSWDGWVARTPKLLQRANDYIKSHLDAAAGGAYLDLTIAEAKALIEKIVSNQGWNKECSQPRTKGGMHNIKETDMLVAKMDLLLKHLHEMQNSKSTGTTIHWFPSCSVCRWHTSSYASRCSPSLIAQNSTRWLCTVHWSKG